MKKIILAAAILFTATWILLGLLEKMLDADMPEWMMEQINREN